MREVILRKLKRAEPLHHPRSELFVLKNFNLHRCVLVVECPAGGAYDPSELRDAVTTAQPASWWRAMAFGVVLSEQDVEATAEAYRQAVDAANNSTGVWQWTILHARDSKRCQGCQTWAGGYLVEVYQNLLRDFDARGYDVRE
jgi:hypothetical protein